ncbi:MAG TPA: N-formylglutamate amidohydrolase [Polyangiaceae bacterium]
MSFSVTAPRGEPTPVVVEVPHAGLEVDPLALASLVASARSLGADADLYVDQLYADAPDEGAALLVARTSRYVCDLNRAETDVDPLAVDGGKARSSPHGLVWRTTTEGRPALASPISAREYERRLDEYHRPYHRALVDLLEERRARHGFAILLCAHSMPSRGRDGHDDAGIERADIVPGTRGRSTAASALIDRVDRLCEEFGLRVRHDEPYRGGFSTAHYGRPHEGIHAIQIELARRLYMDERTLAQRPAEFARLRDFCRRLVASLAAYRPA